MSGEHFGQEGLSPGPLPLGKISRSGTGESPPGQSPGNSPGVRLISPSHWDREQGEGEQEGAPWIE